MLKNGQFLVPKKFSGFYTFQVLVTKLLLKKDQNHDTLNDRKFFFQIEFFNPYI